MTKTKPAKTGTPFDPVARAARHAIKRNQPAPEFMDGAVLGNGHLGVVVTTRPDSVKLYFGHNSVLDVRATCLPMAELGVFEELWARFKAGDRDWVAAYNRKAEVPSETRAPRPWSCGSLLFGFDRRDTELLGHEVHIETGLVEVHFLVKGQRETLQVFAELGADRLWMRMVNGSGRCIAAPFLRMSLRSGGRNIAEPFVHLARTDEEELPSQEWWGRDSITFRQVLPTLAPDRSKDRALQMSCRVSGRIVAAAAKEPYQMPPANLGGGGRFFACLQLRHGSAAEIVPGRGQVPRPTAANFRRAFRTTTRVWADYWRRSGVMLQDAFLEETWYRNQYFLNCAARPGALCPTLYGNWPMPGNSTLWSGEYVMDYNVQQLFWATFSSNRLENNLVYADMIEQILPVARNWARAFYRMPGAFIAQRHWPVETESIPVPWFGWGNHHSPGPWAMQGLWWHYLYSMDREFLRQRAFGPMKEVVEFLNAYLRRPDARGAGSPWNDGKFHLYPTQSPEIWPERFGEPAFSDAIADLALTKFILKAYLRACADLGIEAVEAALLADVREILANFPEYPVKSSPRGGQVYVDVAGAPPDAIYNVPNPLMPFFPGEEHGLHSSKEIRKLAANTWRHQLNEGGNDIVFQNVQGARLGLLDLEKFKRQLKYCQLGNGTFTNMTLQAGGRYHDDTRPDYMKLMGIWVENFALPVVINECLLQSYHGELRVFPNWGRANGDARFQSLRAVGAFLVSASYRSGAVEWVRITSEAGQTLRFINPWGRTLVVRRAGRRRSFRGSLVELPTVAGETIELTGPGSRRQARPRLLGELSE
jgi:alpha-L-fucosidase 2